MMKPLPSLGYLISKTILQSSYFYSDFRDEET